MRCCRCLADSHAVLPLALPAHQSGPGRWPGGMRVPEVDPRSSHPQVLFAPMLLRPGLTHSSIRVHDPPVQSMAWCWQAYGGGKGDGDASTSNDESHLQPGLSPLPAAMPARAIVLRAQRDPASDEAANYARRLAEEAGVHVTVLAVHGTHRGVLLRMDRGNRAFREVVEEMLQDPMLARP